MCPMLSHSQVFTDERMTSIIGGVLAHSRARREKRTKLPELCRRDGGHRIAEKLEDRFREVIVVVVGGHVPGSADIDVFRVGNVLEEFARFVVTDDVAQFSAHEERGNGKRVRRGLETLGAKRARLWRRTAQELGVPMPAVTTIGPL